MWILAIEILKTLFAGDFLRYWNDHKDKVKSEDIANAPLDKKEELDYFK